MSPSPNLVTEGGEGLGKTNKKRTATKSKGSGLEDGANRRSQKLPGCAVVRMSLMPKSPGHKLMLDRQGRETGPRL